MTLKEAAMLYAENGFKIIPLRPKSKEAMYKGGQGWADLASNDPEVVNGWWTKNPEFNIGLPLGVNNLCAIDYDPKDGADENFPFTIPPTYITATPTGGLHPIFRMNGFTDRFETDKKKIAQGVTVRLRGLYVVLPPSIHDELPWPYVAGIPLWKSEIAEIPQWIVDCPEMKLKKKIKDVRIGDRHEVLKAKATLFRYQGIDSKDALERLRQINSQFIDGPKPGDELEKLITWAWQQIPQDPMQKPFPFQTDNGKRPGVIENVTELLKRLGIIVRYNVMSKEKEILVPEMNFSVDNQLNASRALILSECVKNRIGTNGLRDFLLQISDQNLFNPMATWIMSLPWDGQDRLKDFFDTIHSEDNEMKEKLMRAWMIQAVAAAMEPQGIAGAGVLVLQGKQYIGKTQWFKKLCPEKLRKDGMTLNPEDRDSVFQVISSWLVELGELDATFKKSDIAQLKAFITKEKDVLRRPYAQEDSHYARKTVFFASVNEDTFLSDPTGNRRFWSIGCESINYNHGLDMQQVWAQFLKIWEGGESYFLTHDDVKQLGEHNKNFEETDPIEELLRAYDWHRSQRRKMTATEICLELGINTPSQRETRRVSRAIRNITGKKAVKDDGRKFFEMPFKHGPE